ncbi:Rad9-domain-containing protein [Panaeolus papilionaceus]|nr:Rad9-domain-containing protein [Panaeolus papilionaceus]
MQASLDLNSLKIFTRALTCLSKYGDELSIFGTTEILSLSTTNSSKSAYCRFKYENTFFSRYNVDDLRHGNVNVNDEPHTITGQLLTKSLLSILKHKTVEKTVERCEFSIDENASDQEVNEDELNEEHDSLQNKLVIRLHCKHGVIKTHRLNLLTPGSLMAPGVPDADNESRLTIGPKALKDLIDHFPVSRGQRSDPQLVWTFEESEVGLKSLESAIDSRGRGQLSTELTISAEEFEGYDIYETPTTIAFHLREFNATIAFADSMSASMDFRFTDPAAPLFIDIEGDSMGSLFVISTSQVHTGHPSSSTHSTVSGPNRKRERPQSANETPRIRKSMKAAMPIPLDTVQRRQSSRPASSIAGSMPPPSIIPKLAIPSAPSQRPTSRAETSEPLFLPSSQMSDAQLEVLRSTGLGIEDMTAEELTEMLEGEGVEVDFSLPMTQPRAPDMKMEVDANLYSDILEGSSFVATQESQDSSRAFQPLFDD